DPCTACAATTNPPYHQSYPLALPDALPICARATCPPAVVGRAPRERPRRGGRGGEGPMQARRAETDESAGCDVRSGSAPMRNPQDRKSTRLNSSHVKITYAVF